MSENLLSSASKNLPKERHIHKSVVFNISFTRNGLNVLAQKVSDNHPSKGGKKEFPGGKQDYEDIMKAFSLNQDVDNVASLSDRITASRENREETGISSNPEDLLFLGNFFRKFPAENTHPEYNGIIEHYYVNWIPSNISLTPENKGDDFIDSFYQIPLDLQDECKEFIRLTLNDPKFLIGRDDFQYAQKVIKSISSRLKAVIYGKKWEEKKQKNDSQDIYDLLLSENTDITQHGFSFTLSNGEKISGIADTIHEVCDMYSSQKYALLEKFFYTHYPPEGEFFDSDTQENVDEFFGNTYFASDFKNMLEKFFPFIDQNSTVITDALKISSFEGLKSFAANTSKYGDCACFVPEIISLLLKLKVVWDKGYMRKERGLLQFDFQNSVQKNLNTHDLSSVKRVDSKTKDLFRIISKMDRKVNDMGDLNDFCQMRIYLDNSSNLQNESKNIITALHKDPDYNNSLNIEIDDSSTNVSAGERHEIKVLGKFKGKPIEIQIATEEGFQKSETEEFYHSFYSGCLQYANMRTRLFLRSGGKSPLLEKNEIDSIITKALSNPKAYKSGRIEEDQKDSIRINMWKRLSKMGFFFTAQDNSLADHTSAQFVDYSHFFRLFPRYKDKEFFQPLIDAFASQVNDYWGIKSEYFSSEDWKEFLYSPYFYIRKRRKKYAKIYAKIYEKKYEKYFKRPNEQCVSKKYNKVFINMAKSESELFLKKICILLFFHISGESGMLHREIKALIPEEYERISIDRQNYKKYKKILENISDGKHEYKDKVTDYLEKIEKKYGLDIEGMGALLPEDFS